MLLPYSVDVPFERLPVANWALIGLTFLISVGVWIDQPRAEPTQPPLTGSAQEPAKPPIVPALALQPRDFAIYQLVTHQFVHTDSLRLLSSLLFLFVLGNSLNAKLGPGLYLTLYVVVGMAAGLVWRWAGDSPLLGCQGAVMGVAGLFFVFFPRDKVTVGYWNPSGGMGSFEVSAFWMLGLFPILDLTLCLLGGGGGAVFGAHLAGGASGIVAGIVLLKTGLVLPSNKEENLLQTIGLEKKTKEMTLLADHMQEEKIYLEQVKIRSKRSHRKGG